MAQLFPFPSRATDVKPDPQSRESRVNCADEKTLSECAARLSNTFEQMERIFAHDPATRGAQRVTGRL
jgi:hypothetical protein